jgi:GNAT superfamily N-acetyltransferase
MPKTLLERLADGPVICAEGYVFELERRGYLQDLFTAADARGQGVGRALIEGVYKRAQDAGSPRVYWQTHETNTTAMQLYDKVALKSGFVVYRQDLPA